MEQHHYDGHTFTVEKQPSGFWTVIIDNQFTKSGFEFKGTAVAYAHLRIRHMTSASRQPRPQMHRSWR